VAKENSDDQEILYKDRRRTAVVFIGGRPVTERRRFRGLYFDRWHDFESVETAGHFHRGYRPSLLTQASKDGFVLNSPGYWRRRSLLRGVNRILYSDKAFST
jgi:hypothetical protein